MTDVKLEPCYFCGQDPHWGSAYLPDRDAWYAFAQCNNHTFDLRVEAYGEIREAAEDKLIRHWNGRCYVETTRRIIKGDGMTHYAWCEAGEHTMSPTGDRCNHCGRRVVETCPE